MEQLTPHNIRRGSAGDLAALKAPVGMSTDRVANLIGHGRVSIQSGLKAHYIGPSMEDTLAKRVRELRHDPMTDLRTTDRPSKRLKKKGGFRPKWKTGKDPKPSPVASRAALPAQASSEAGITSWQERDTLEGV